MRCNRPANVAPDRYPAVMLGSGATGVLALAAECDLAGQLVQPEPVDGGAGPATTSVIRDIQLHGAAARGRIHAMRRTGARPGDAIAAMERALPGPGPAGAFRAALERASRPRSESPGPAH